MHARLTRALQRQRVPYRNADMETWGSTVRELAYGLLGFAAVYALIVCVLGLS